MRKTRRAKRTRKVKVRKNIRYFCLTISLLGFVFSCYGLILNSTNNKVENKKVEIYSYTNKFNYDYTVNLIKNKYIDEESLTDKNAYVTDLIKDIDIDLNYAYNGSKNSNIKYDYSIDGYLSAVYTQDTDEEKILEKKYEILNKKDNNSNDGKVDVIENINLNLQEQNELIKDFETKMNINVDATYTVILNVVTHTKIDNQDIENNYQSQIVIGLANKTTKVEGDNNKEETQYVNSVEERNINVSPVERFFYIVLMITTFLLFEYVFRKTENLNRIRNEYRLEVNRILKLCKEKIVQVKEMPQNEDSNTIEVKDFGEIIKLSEELFRPILYWENREAEEAWFVVMSNEVIYKYILRKY